MLTAAVLTGVVSFTKLNVAAPVATAVDTFGPEWGWLAKLIKIGAIAGLSSVVLVLMFGQTRVFYSMSRDGLLPKTLAKVHPKFKTPWINTHHRRCAGIDGRRCSTTSTSWVTSPPWARSWHSVSCVSR